MSCYTPYVIWLHVYLRIIQLIEIRVIDISILIFLVVFLFYCTCNVHHQVLSATSLRKPLHKTDFYFLIFIFIKFYWFLLWDAHESWKYQMFYLNLFYKSNPYILLCWKKIHLPRWSFQAINLWIHFHFQHSHHQQQRQQRQQRSPRKISQENNIIYLQLQQAHFHNRPPKPPEASQLILLHSG